jgi:adenosine deaminase
MNKTIKNFLNKIPKTDIHVHLDGSLRLSTLIELAKQAKVELPSYEETGLRETVFKDKYNDLPDYLRGFSYTCAVMQNAENLERIAYELAQDNLLENVRYLEVRYAPHLHINRNLPSIDKIVQAVYKGLEKARVEHDNTEAVKNGKDIPFKYGIILGAMRYFNENMSPYFAGLLSSMPYAPSTEVYKIASLELARAAVELRDDLNLPIVGFDLCGPEKGFPAIDHHDAYRYAHKNFMEKTVHAGEAYGPESIFQAITDCHANRIGHGTFLYHHDTIKDSDIKNPEKFSYYLAEYIAKRRITIEVCPTSNLQTIPKLRSILDHPVKDMIKNRLSVSVCTDNRLVSNTNVVKELSLIVNNVHITKKQLQDLVIAGFKGCFYHGSYSEHRAFVRTALNQYKLLEKEILGDISDSDIL